MLNLGFGLLCIRFLFAAGHSGNWSLVMLGVASFALGWWHPAASLFALILSLSLASGLERTVLHVPYSTVLTIASALWLGLIARKIFPAPTAEGTCVEPAESANRAAGWMMLIVEVLATIALLALFIQVWHQNATPGFWTPFWHQAHYSPADPAYFLTSGFLWLHGLFCFRAIREHLTAVDLAPTGIKLAFLVNGVVLLLFHGVQWLLDFPARWIPGFESPYEDIATFGIMATCFLTVCLTLMRRSHARSLFVLIPGALLLAIAVGASWSRGTWLACTIALGVLAVVRLPRSVTILLTSSLLGAVIFLNLSMERGSLPDWPYLGRVASLVRFEAPLTKLSDRSELHLKALTMIGERPWTGHGIGTFFLRAPRYARPGDSSATIPQLPHNLLLQLAAEQGVPVAGLFLCLVGTTLWRGARCWVEYARLNLRHIADPPEAVRSRSLLALGLTLMLAAYLQANMTWDILLIHPTQPFFFWLLMAALLATTDHANAPISSLGKSLAS